MIDFAAGANVEVVGGGYVDLLDPDPATIRLDDVAHALAHLCRFGGQSRVFYSVAEHAVGVAQRLYRTGAPAPVCLAGLHHDDAEAYLGDVTRPLKAILPGYKELEGRIDSAIRTALGFGGTAFLDRRIKEADDWMLAAEAHHLLRSKGIPWAPVPYEPDRTCPVGLLPPEAKRQFLEAHEALSRAVADAQDVWELTKESR